MDTTMPSGMEVGVHFISYTANNDFSDMIIVLVVTSLAGTAAGTKPLRHKHVHAGRAKPP
jgi:hypothetical protein